MGIMSTPSLAAAVSNTGALGGLGMWGLSAEEAGRRIAGFRQQSGGGLNVNYPLWPEPRLDADDVAAMQHHLQAHYDDKGLGRVPTPQGIAGELTAEHLEMLLETKPEVVSFHFGLPKAEIVEAIKAAGIFIISSATTASEARFLEANGVDAVIAQGTEAGGHRATFAGVDMSMQAGLLSLLPQVVDAVRVPVIAAGGIADGRTVAAAFMLGASAVQMGTAFLHCDEANVLPAHREALGQADESCTVVTDLISGRPARYIRNRLLDDLVSSKLKPLPIPMQLSLTLPLGASGDRELTVLLAGQSAGLAPHTSAADLVQSLGEEALRRLRSFA
jgi:nitronate monooxygenase